MLRLDPVSDVGGVADIRSTIGPGGAALGVKIARESDIRSG